MRKLKLLLGSILTEMGWMLVEAGDSLQIVNYPASEDVCTVYKLEDDMAALDADNEYDDDGNYLDN